MRARGKKSTLQGEFRNNLPTTVAQDATSFADPPEPGYKSAARPKERLTSPTAHAVPYRRRWSAAMLGLCLGLGLSGGGVAYSAPAPEGQAVVDESLEKLLKQAAAATQAGDYQAAAEKFFAAVLLAPRDEELLTRCAAAAAWQGDHARGVAYLRRAASLAADEEAYNRVTSYQQQIWTWLYNMPAWATEKRQAATAANTQTPAAVQAVARYQELYRAAQAALVQGQHQQALPPANQAVELALGTFGPNHPYTSTAYNLRGDIQRLASQWGAARLDYEHALRGALATLGEEHPDALVYLSNLGAIDESQGALKEAGRSYSRAYRSARKSLGEDSFVTLTYVNNLAMLLHRRGKPKRAARMLDVVYRRKVKLLGPEHYDTLSILLNLSRTLLASGKKAGAQRLFARGFALSAATLGEEHPIFAGFAEDLGGMVDLGDPRVVVEILSNELGEGAALTLEATLLYGQRLQAAGDFAAAEQRFNRVLTGRRALYGPEHRSTIVATHQLGQFMVTLGRYGKAEELFSEAWQRLQVLEGEQHPDTLRVASSLALLYDTQGRYAEAHSLIQRILALAREHLGADHEDTLDYLNNSALIAGSRGELHTARELYEKLHHKRLTSLGPDHEQSLRAQHNLAHAYSRLSLHDRARTLALKALDGRRKLLGETHPVTLVTLSGLATICVRSGDYAAAQKYYQEALDLRRKSLGTHHPQTLQTLGDLAELFVYQNRLDKAEPLLKEVIDARQDALGADHPETLSAQANLAEIHARRGRWRQAEDLLRDLIARSEQVLGRNSSATLVRINNLAVLMDNTGRAKDSVPLYQRIVEQSSRRLGKDHSDTLAMKANLATTYDSLEQPQKAHPLHREVLAARRRILGPSHPATLVSIANMAIHLQQQGKLDAAEPLWRDSLTGTAVFLDRVLWGADAGTRAAYIEDLRYLNSQLMNFYLHRASPAAARDALSFALLRKGLLLKVAAESRALLKASQDPALEKLSTQLTGHRAKLARLTLQAEGSKKERQQLSASVESLERRIGESVSWLKRHHAHISPRQVIEQLKEDEALIEYLAFVRLDLKTSKPIGRALAAVVARKNRAPTLIDLGEFAGIGEQQLAFLDLLKNAGDGDTTVRLGQTLYQRLVEPLRQALGDASTLLIVADGPLHLLPFAALRQGQGADGSYLLETHQLMMLSSSRDVVLPPAPATDEPGAIFSAPDYRGKPRKGKSRTRGGRLRDMHFQPLPGSAIEGKQIAALLRKSGIAHRHFSGAQASELQLTRLGHAPRILHLATHGFFLSQNGAPSNGPALAGRTRGLYLGTRPQNHAGPAIAPIPLAEDPLLRAGLAFVGANRGLHGKRMADGSDGILTASEALDLDLVGTQLVVLSACDTGVGDIQAGEGVFGLRRAFQQAGAHSVLSTLWSVDDAMTQKLMAEFYRLVVGGTAPALALRQVQLAIIADGGDQAHPYFWAAYTLVSPP